MAKYPAVKAALGDYARARARFRYLELYEKLGLTPEKIARFEELAAYPGMGAPGPGGGELQLIWNPESRGGHNDELATLLGSEGIKLYWELEARNESRDFVVHMAGALWSSPTPLTPEQADRLVEIVQTSQTGSGPIAASRVDWAAVIARARDFLTPAQLAVLEAEQAHAEVEAALNRAMSPLAKKTPNP
ncbi:MAG: hypothetical protein NTV51_09195, partial [Verrucomicrobia bacterium]|nr:hypothetical protein [Verrucomicrobiota bacterium]